MKSRDDIYELVDSIFFAGGYKDLQISETTEFGKQYRAVLIYDTIDKSPNDETWYNNCKNLFLRFNIIVQFSDDDNLNAEYQILYFNKEDVQKMIIYDKLEFG